LGKSTFSLLTSSSAGFGGKVTVESDPVCSQIEQQRKSSLHDTGDTKSDQGLLWEVDFSSTEHKTKEGEETFSLASKGFIAVISSE
jgi:hypothetical protein